MSLIFPQKILDQHAVVLGKTGAGKSSAFRHVVEHLLDHNKRVCIIDPKGDWWGLKASADGKGAGYPIITFGDFKNENATDVPINAQSGKHVAELITSGNRPAIIGFRGWMTSHMVQFWIDFASGIFNANSGELYLVIDECHNFAPKGKIMDPQAGKCLHWSNRLMSEGRGLGIVNLIASQRPQKVHNDTLTSCETLIAMRVIHAADRSAVEDWIKGCGDKDQGKEVLNALAGMARGEAYVWSPEAGFGPKRISFPMFNTFDSFAPPQLQKKVSQRGWADVNLDEVKEKLASVIEEAKQNDPRALRQELTKARMELLQVQQQATSLKTQPKIETKRVEVPILKNGQFERLEKMESRLAAMGREFWSKIEELQKTLNSAGAAALHPNNRRAGSSVARADAGLSRESVPAARRERHVAGSNPAPRADSDFQIAPRHQALINALAFYESIGSAKITKGRHAAFVARSNDGGYRNDLSAMRTAGIIEYPTPGEIALTQEGRTLVTEIPNIRRQADLHKMWLDRFPPRQAQILAALLNRYPDALSKDDLASILQRTNDGGFRNDLSAMRTLGTIDYPRPGTVVASENLFPAIPA